ncbi:SDR family NAD(P)-dependent oxidoreductase [Streptomyces sp. NPDC092369]|uniref:SDR family NAD(P)-dependent oxidoreductase n=1 Tax=Streptomyces sp. NPDC092369 TaxID=3366015 RepID=UPI0037FBD47B
MVHELDGRTAVVTGASRGIGLAVVRALAAEGARVVAGARHTSDELAELAKSGAVEVVEVDLATEAGPARLVERAGERIDILVNNVGAAPVRPDGFLSITDEDWLSTFTLNLLTTVRTTRAVLPAMLARGEGSIVTIASVNSSLPDPLVLDYSVSKAAVAAFSKGLSKEVGGQGVRVNTVSPGPVATDLWLSDSGVAATVGRATGADRASVAEGAARSMVSGRFTQPAEVAEAVLYLAGPRSGNVLGADIRIDGGLIPTW